MDDFGKTKDFLKENGPLEIAEDSRYYLQCEKCGCSIRSGRFCHGCAKELANGIKRMLFAEVGEKPKPEYEVKAKVHFDTFSLCLFPAG